MTKTTRAISAAIAFLLVVMWMALGRPQRSHAQSAGFGPVYQAGWNLVGGPSGTTLTGAVLPLYTLQANDSNYETINSNVLTAPEGYWAYFSVATPVPLPAVSAGPVSVSLPANHLVMVGNPFADTALLSGADQVLIYLPGNDNYAAVSVLNAGQGAWAYCRTACTLTMVAASTRGVQR